jgi:hypothetical protein
LTENYRIIGIIKEMLMATVKDALWILGYGSSETVASEIFVIASEKGERERHEARNCSEKTLSNRMFWYAYDSLFCNSCLH